MHESTIGLAALAIALLTFVSTQLSMRRSADKDHVNSIQDRVRENELRLADCEKDRTRLTGDIERVRDENLFLMRRVLDVEGRVNLSHQLGQVGRAAERAYGEANSVNAKLLAIGERREQADQIAPPTGRKA